MDYGDPKHRNICYYYYFIIIVYTHIHNKSNLECIEGKEPTKQFTGEDRLWDGNPGDVATRRASFVRVNTKLFSDIFIKYLFFYQLNLYLIEFFSGFRPFKFPFKTSVPRDPESLYKRLIKVDLNWGPSGIFKQPFNSFYLVCNCRIIKELLVLHEKKFFFKIT